MNIIRKNSKNLKFTLRLKSIIIVLVLILNNKHLSSIDYTLIRNIYYFYTTFHITDKYIFTLLIKTHNFYR